MNTRHSYPASYPAVVSVGAVDENEVIAAFSQQTSQVELAGPGVAVLSSVPRGTGERVDLSVAGTVFDANAMEGSAKGSASGALVNCGIGSSACTGRDVAYGFGLVQAKAAVDYLNANSCSGSGGDTGGGDTGGDTGGGGKGGGKGGKK